MPHLIAAVYVQDPDTHEDLVLTPGDEPPPQIAVLITNREAWDTPPEVVGVMVEEEVDVVVEQEAPTGEKKPPA
ncbi:hypothetical protein K7472_07900 [Streptomyces sp. PTM05]|uniref:Uncharacterized protein n=1 Tax=Streptantibioticus parmotrematis TaxID=2873249 RepID=A0ABS7QNL1_9ACTN|nr:hypothetical protein [Streptantibioticus parmotrematis]MBY8884767.1 hypothetical protein [Streptantibioticus parmotrematis]